LLTRQPKYSAILSKIRSYRLLFRQFCPLGYTYCYKHSCKEFMNDRQNFVMYIIRVFLFQELILKFFLLDANYSLEKISVLLFDLRKVLSLLAVIVLFNNCKLKSHIINPLSAEPFSEKSVFFVCVNSIFATRFLTIGLT